MKKQTLNEYLSLSTNRDIPLKRLLTANQLAVIKAILLSKAPSLTMVTGSRCAGRSSALAIASILHALHGDGNILALATNIQHCNYSIRHCIEQWIGTVSPCPSEWEFRHYPTMAFTCRKTGATIYIESMNSLRRICDPLYYYVKLKNVGFAWIDDLEEFHPPMSVAHYFVNRCIPCKIAISYQVQSWHDETQHAVSTLKPFITSSHTMMVSPRFSHQDLYDEIRRMEAARRQMLKASNFYKKSNADIRRKMKS